MRMAVRLGTGFKSSQLSVFEKISLAAGESDPDHESTARDHIQPLIGMGKAAWMSFAYIGLDFSALLSIPARRMAAPDPGVPRRTPCQTSLV